MKDLQEIISNVDQQLEYAEKVSGNVFEKLFPETESEKVTKYVLLQLGGYGIGIPIKDLFEIGLLPAVTPLPNLPAWIRGIINLRGEIVSVVDLMEFFTGRRNTRNSSQRLAVLQSRNVKVGILVDKIVATINRTDSELKRRAATEKNNSFDFVFKTTLKQGNDTFDIMDVGSLMKLKSLRNYYDAEV